MLIDEIEITITGGHGGAGKVSFGPGKYSGPDGGNGGRGGDVYIKVTTDLYALNQFSKTKIVEGSNGQGGGGVRKSGEDGRDIEIVMPIGTEILDKETGEVFTLDNKETRILIAKGGLGGRGNWEFRSPTNTTPRYAQKGLPGQKRNLKVLLKLIADFGLIGLPNAGKSSLLNEITAANAKIGDYQFTTLEPNLGVLDGRVIADLPGLIEGAATGKGLGIKFLKHIEKVGLLLHCIQAESDNLKRDYTVIKKELGEYNPKLLEKKEIILLTKTDLVNEKDLRIKIKDLRKLNKDILEVSIHNFDSLEKLKKLLLSTPR
jgi:GTPase